MSKEPKRFAIIGGGVAGITAAEELLNLIPEGIQVTLITASPTLKQVGKVVQLTRNLEELDVIERDAAEFVQEQPKVNLLVRKVQSLKPKEKLIICEDGDSIPYDRCLVCSGAKPKLVLKNPNVLGIRDTESVDELSARLSKARRVIVLGNGGIALEVIQAIEYDFPNVFLFTIALFKLSKVKGCEIIWAIKDSYIGNTFFDASASDFIIPHLKKDREIFILSENPRSSSSTSTSSSTAHTGGGGDNRKRRYEKTEALPVSYGGALGPEWTKMLTKEDNKAQEESGRAVHILFNTEFQELIEGKEGDEWPLEILFDNGKNFGCDFVISATGVIPEVSFLGPEFKRGGDGGVLVDENMRTTGSGDVFAAGDCCCMVWPPSDYWFQMRLWNQARSMAIYAAKCMTESVDELGSGCLFEIFAHATHFFGYKVTLLGCYNAQDLASQENQDLMKEIIVRSDGSIHSRVLETNKTHTTNPTTTSTTTGDSTSNTSTPAGSPSSTNGSSSSSTKLPPMSSYTTTSTTPPPSIEIWTRVTPGEEYIKVVVVDGKVKGAMLIGETDLEETFENLILNGLDVSRYGVHMLDPDFDLEDYFD